MRRHVSRTVHCRRRCLLQDHVVIMIVIGITTAAQVGLDHGCRGGSSPHRLVDILLNTGQNLIAELLGHFLIVDGRRGVLLLLKSVLVFKWLERR